jgi:DNA (cytosine-5)-methyltransferase 1
MAGNREKDWGKEKKFREGQELQVLDTLFFDFIDLANELKPKVVVAENVKGLLLGSAKEYVIKIYKAFDEAGYTCQHFLLNASKMGVPQRRERVFFIALRKDLSIPFMEYVDMFTELPKLELKFNEKEILFKEVYTDYTDRKLSPAIQKLWYDRIDSDNDMGSINERIHGKPTYFGHKFTKMNEVNKTIIAGDNTILYDYPRLINKFELCKVGSYPLDYNFLKLRPEYLIGMSVPPLMTGKIAEQIYIQWLSKL